MQKIKDNLSLIIALILTLLYLASLFYLFFDLNKFIENDLSAKGDFLSGAFAPLAFLWLVFGYYQQGKELKQNTNALKLQAKELANNVKQQKQILEISKSELELKHFEARPHLCFHASNFEILSKTATEYDDDSGHTIAVYAIESADIIIKIENKGDLIRELSISVADPTFYSFEWDAYEIQKNEITKMHFYLIGDELDFLIKNPKQDIEFDIIYHDKYGRKYHERINVYIFPSRDCSGSFSVYVKKI